MFLFNLDVNECMFNNGGCQGDCCNSIGSYYCRCAAGYELSHDGVTCIGKYCRDAKVQQVPKYKTIFIAKSTQISQYISQHYVYKMFKNKIMLDQHF